MAVINPSKTCLRKAKNQLEKHQMGFDGEHIGEVVLRRLGYKGVKLTSHKSKFDILTSREAWEIKTIGRDALDKKMSVKAKQKLEKLAWAKRNKKRPKSMMVIVNDSADVYIRDGLGKFRPGGMTKVRTFKDWRKEVGHGRTERLVEGKPPPKFVWKKTNDKDDALWQFMDTFGWDDANIYWSGKSAVDVLNQFGEHMAGVYSKFPQLKSMRKGRLLTISKELKNMRGKTTGGLYNSAEKSIELIGVGPIKNDLGLGAHRFLVGEDLLSAMRHEWGHRIQDTMLTGELSKKWYKLYESYDWSKTVSKYAGTAPTGLIDEAFAEAFSAYSSPLYKKGMLPNEVEKFFKELLET